MSATARDPAIRRADAADLPALNALIQASSTYHGEYRAMVATYMIGPAQVARDQMYLAEQDGAVVGFYSLTLGAEPELDLMFVADHLHGGGLGRALIEHLKATARARGVEEIKVVSHPPSVGFYKRVGAVEAGVKPPAGRVTWARPILMLKV
ncbi:MAG TPA: GNAT family N-acetyltransferase [Dongiaceae bacterium]|nr:GNAT family N-acetyltransferase [Dongiaceae bacterium]